MCARRARLHRPVRADAEAAGQAESRADRHRRPPATVPAEGRGRWLPDLHGARSAHRRGGSRDWWLVADVHHRAGAALLRGGGAMTSGRELNALVAEKVMGLVWDEERCRVCGWPLAADIST